MTPCQYSLGLTDQLTESMHILTQSPVLLGKEDLGPTRFRGVAGHVVGLIAEIDVLQRKIDACFLHCADDLLQIIALFPADPELLSLNRRLHL